MPVSIRRHVAPATVEGMSHLPQPRARRIPKPP
jgi:hypothetical protein